MVVDAPPLQGNLPTHNHISKDTYEVSDLSHIVDNVHNDYDDDDEEEEEEEEDPISLKSLSPDGQSDGEPGQNRPWYLLGLSGNVSVVHARQADFLKYLRQGIRTWEH